jgi:2-amino-4-hydroxy-6-hydroxymethyldihydropteridine diphosphokinase
VTHTLAFIGLGSNLDRPRRHVASALAALARLPRSRLVATSRNYVTAPVGCADPQPDYVNAVAVLRTALTPGALLAHLHGIERRQGRTRGALVARNAARTLDLDLLIFGRRRARRQHLSLPHPRMHERAFVLKPLLDVAPAAIIPGRGAARMLARRTHGQRVEATWSQRRR